MSNTKRMLIQLQLSNYDKNGRFILEADSGYQMAINRAREMLKLCDDLEITILGPDINQCVTSPFDVNPDLWEKYHYGVEKRLFYVGTKIIPNALATRYDFSFENLATILFDHDQTKCYPEKSPRYDYVYINDPMHLRNFKALFHTVGKYTPKFIVHSHFIDNPECPKFPEEASLWLGQCEAAIRADYNFWQCESAMNIFFNSASKIFNREIVDKIRKKSSPWDDGYSTEEISAPVNEKKLRFSTKQFHDLSKDKVVIFVPNRVGGKGVSSDYTNCGKFLFDVLPLVKRKSKYDFVVIAGNPNQKFSNDDLLKACGKYGYVKLVPDALNREEYKFVARNSHIAVGLYDQDSYGGTAARECIDLGCMPLWVKNYEYASIAKEAGISHLLSKTTKVEHLVDATVDLISLVKNQPKLVENYVDVLQTIVRDRCSYESTTRVAMKKIGLL